MFPTSLILYGLIASLFSLIGGLLVVWKDRAVKKIMLPLIAFAAGTFLSVSFLDLLPEAIELVEEPHYIFISVLAGFFVFFAMERSLMKYFHVHEEGNPKHAEHTESLPLLVIVGDTLHNFLDGIVIALAFVANPAIGLATAFAVAAHEVPQEIGDFAILLDQNWSKVKIIIVNIFSSLLTLVGVVVGYFAAGLFENNLAYLLAGVSGIFIYIAASDLIPEVHHRAGHKYLYHVLFSFLLGLILVGILVLLTQE